MGWPGNQLKEHGSFSHVGKKGINKENTKVNVRKQSTHYLKKEKQNLGAGCYFRLIFQFSRIPTSFLIKMFNLSYRYITPNTLKELKP